MNCLDQETANRINQVILGLRIFQDQLQSYLPFHSTNPHLSLAKLLLIPIFKFVGPRLLETIQGLLRIYLVGSKHRSRNKKSTTLMLMVLVLVCKLYSNMFTTSVSWNFMDVNCSFKRFGAAILVGLLRKLSYHFGSGDHLTSARSWSVVRQM